MATPKPTKTEKAGQVYYRVRVRRPAKGIHVDEYFTTKKQADRYCRELASAIETGKPIAKNVGEVVTFSEAADQYLAEPITTRKGAPLKASTDENRRVRINVLVELFGQTRLKNLTWEAISETLDKKAWNAANRYRYETALSRMLAFCKRKGWVAFNVVEGQDRHDKTKQRKRVYTETEWAALLSAADDRTDMLAMFLRLSWATGARKSELLNLRWVDVEEVEHEALGAALWLRDTKTGEDRTVYIDKSTYELLRSHEQQFRRASSDLVFPSRTRGGTYKIDGPFREARDKADLSMADPKYGEVLTIHHIRHSWATRLGDNGASLAQLMAAAGWKTPGMAARYMHRKQSQSAEAAVLLAQL